MKLVIDIPEEKYEWVKKNNPNIDTNSFVGAIANGTPYEERPKGKWINFNSYFRKCSLCQKIVGFDYIEQNGERFNFCPNCGADMRGDEK